MRRRVSFQKAIFLAVLFFFFLKGFFLLDTDFGWHLRMGQIIFQNGIPKTDPFSYTMPSFPFVDHEWLTNTIIAFLYPIIGMIGLSLLFSGITVSSLLFLLKGQLRIKMLIPFLLSSGILLSFGGVRTQVITWCFFSILITLLFDALLWKKWKWALPFLFILWANLHGGFAIGIAVLIVVFLLRTFEERQISIRDVGVLFACIGATLINPYGFRLWGEVWNQISDQNLRFAISEWSPLIFEFDPFIWTIITSLSIGLYRYRKNFSFSEIGLYFFLLLISISSIRHFPFFALFSLLVFPRLINYYSEDAKRFSKGPERLNTAFLKVGVVFCGIFLIYAILALYNARRYSQSVFYPSTSAITVLQNRKFNGHTFSVYEWNGYLIWKLPRKKEFIDGRMPSWRWTPPSPRESGYAFKEYEGFLSGKISLKTLVDKYHITTILWPTKNITHQGSLLDILYIVFHIQPVATPTHENNFSTQLKKNRFQKVYQDSTAVIYEK